MIKNILILIVIVVVNFTPTVKSAKILGIFPTSSISHQVVFRALTKELLKRSHEITVITTDPMYPKGMSPENLTEIDVHDISYDLMREMGKDHVVTKQLLGYSDEKAISIFISALFEIQLNSTEVQDLLLNRNKQFDLILLEAIARPALIISHIFKAPVILVSSLGSTLGLNEIVGTINHPVMYPTAFNRKIYNLSLIDKIGAFYKYIINKYENCALQKNEHLMLQKYFGSNIPSFSDLYDNVDMLFLNVHPLWADNQPTPPNVVYMGGIHQAESKVLPQDLKTYIDNSKYGVIYLSFGTNALASMIPKEKVEIIVNVLSRLPYDVLWKWDQDELPIDAKNIKLSKWFLQADLLKHPNIKLFITQAGLQSTDESITAGVPLLAIPMLGDQWYNAEKYVLHGIGKKILIENLNLEIFKDAVETVINDESYRRNIIKLRDFMRDQPQTPVERSMWWIEHILRHGGGKHLRSPAANISLAQYLEIDALLIILFALVLALTLIVTAIFIVYRFMRSHVFSVKMKKIKNN